MMELHVCDRKGGLLRAFAIGDRSEIIIGRDEHCDVQIRSASISSEHCAIEPDGTGLILRDLDSTSGTLIGGRRVSCVEIRDGLEVMVGPAVLRFVDGEV